MKARTGMVFALLAAGAFALAPAPASAQGAASTRIDPSVRSAGMGGASTAVPWSEDVNGWANPALLGYVNGIRYGWSGTRLVPDLASDVGFQSDRFSYGWGGVGLGVESHTVDYGRIELTDAGGTPIGTYNPIESTRPLLGAISVSRAAEAVARLRGGAVPGFTRYADVAIGFSRKRVRLRLAPPGYGGEARTVASDFGLLVRATPLPSSGAGRPFFDLNYGFAALNYNDAQLTFIDESEPGYVARQYRHGIAGRFGIPLPQVMAASLEQNVGRWIASGMEPLVSVAVAADKARFRFGPQQTSGYDVDHLGVELAIANTLAVRFGYVSDVDGDITDYTFGLGLGFSLADFASARYDYSSYPQARTLSKLDRHAVAVWFDPVAFVHRQR